MLLNSFGYTTSNSLSQVGQLTVRYLCAQRLPPHSSKIDDSISRCCHVVFLLAKDQCSDEHYPIFTGLEVIEHSSVASGVEPEPGPIGPTGYAGL